jgi:hypothetical protein
MILAFAARRSKVVPAAWAGSYTVTVTKTGLGTAPLLLLDVTYRGDKLERPPTNAVVCRSFL